MKDSERPVTRQRSWRAAPMGQQRGGAGLALGLRRLAALGLMLLMMCLFWVMIRRPIEARRTQIAILTGNFPGAPPDPEYPALPFLEQDSNTLLAVAPVLRQNENEPTRVHLHPPLRARSDIEQLKHYFKQNLVTDNDVVVVYIRADGVTIGGEPHLKWAFAPNWSTEKTLPVEDVIDELDNCPGHTKLLILDCGSVTQDLNNGMLANNFVSQVDELIGPGNKRVSDFWVVTSRADFQQSLYSRQLGQTVFAAAVARALSGEADANDDLSLTVAEFFRYVNFETAHWTEKKSAGALRQTPRLLHWPKSDESPELIALGRRYVPNEQEDGAEAQGPPEEPADDTPEGAADAALHWSQELFGQKPLLATIMNLPLPQSGKQRTTDSSVAEQTPDAESVSSADTEDQPKPGNANASSQSTDQAAAEPADDDFQPASSIWTGSLQAWHIRDEIIASDLAPQLESPVLWRRLESLLLSLQTGLVGQAEVEDVATNAALSEIVTLLRKQDTSPTTRYPVLAQRLRQVLQPAIPAPYVTNSLSVCLPLSLLGLRAASPDEKELASELAALLETGSREEWSSWLADHDALVEAYDDIRFIHKVVGQAELSWQTARDLVQLRILADETAVLGALYPNLLNTAVERADRRRLSLQRQFVDGVPVEDASAEALLAVAIQDYSKIKRDTNFLIQLESDCRQHLYDAREFVQCYRIMADSRLLPVPEYSDLEQYLKDLLICLEKIKNKPNRGNDLNLRQAINLLQTTNRRLKATQAKLQRVIDAAVDLASGAAPTVFSEQQCRQLLRLPKLSVSQRDRLFVQLQSITPIEWSTAPGRLRDEREPAMSDPYVWAVALNHAKLEFYCCKLMVVHQTDKDALIQEVNKKKLQDAEAAPNPVDRAKRLNEFGQSVLEFQNRISNRVSDALRLAADTPEDTSLQAARSWEPALYLLPAERLWTSTDSVFQNMTSLRHRRASLKLAESRKERIQLSIKDAPEAERKRLWEELKRLPPDSDAEFEQLLNPELTVKAPASVAQQSLDQVTVPIQLELGNLTEKDLEVRVIAEYDNRQLAVRGGQDFPLYTASDIRKEDLAKFNDSQIKHRIRLALPTNEDSEPEFPYPLMVNTSNTTPTIRLKAQSTQPLPLFVKLRSPSTRDLKVILRFQSPNNYLRRDVVVNVPHPPIAQIHEVAPASAGSTSDVNVELFCLPNRIMPFSLRSHTQLTSDVQCELYAAAARKPELPRYSVTMTEAGNVLHRSTRGVALAVATMQDGSDEFDSPLKFVMPEATDEISESSAEETTLPSNEEKKAAVEYGFVAKFTESQTQRVSFQHIPISVQHPRRFLKTTASFEPGSRRLRVTVATRNPELSGDDVVALRLAISGNGDLRNGQQATGTLDRQRSSVELTTVLPEELNSTVRAELDVDGFPMAYAWTIRPGVSSGRLEEAKTFAIEVIHPKPDTPIPLPAKHLDATLRIEAPPGFPASPVEKIVVGIDEGRDRDLVGDRVIELPSKHATAVFWEGVAEDGQLLLRASVGNPVVKVPINYLDSGRVNLLAKLVTGSGDVWSHPIELALDGVAPAVTSVDVDAASGDAVGQPLTIVAKATDNQLSGIESLTAAYYSPETESFLEAVPPVQLEAKGGIWTAALDTAALAPGTHTVGVVAVDYAGNTSAIKTSRPIRLLSEEEAAKMAAEAVNLVSGTVFYATEIVPEAKIRLELAAKDAAEPPERALGPVETDDQGNFRIPDVRVGTYKLTAEKVVRGLTRRKTRIIEVKPAPKRLYYEFQLR